MRRPVRVLIIDDSTLVCDILSRGLVNDPGIEIVGTAHDPYEARDKIIQLKPDVLTLDIEMPRMNGVAFLKKLMPQYPLPVVMVSALTERSRQITLDALEAGALDFVTKPSGDAAGLAQMMLELRTKIIIASTAQVAHWKGSKAKRAVHARTPGPVSDKIVVIGASTGGVEAIREIVENLPAAAPGMVIVQHMPAGFTRVFAERLNTLGALRAKEAAQDDRVLPGHLLVAPGGRHMSLACVQGEYRVRIADGELVNGHKPSVEVLMHSAAECAGPHAIGVMLTGMGKDGAAALKEMRDRGARCLAQDQASSVVFGMPKVAWELGGAEKLVPLKEIADTIMAWTSTSKAKELHGG